MLNRESFLVVKPRKVLRIFFHSGTLAEKLQIRINQFVQGALEMYTRFFFYIYTTLLFKTSN